MNGNRPPAEARVSDQGGVVCGRCTCPLDPIRKRFRIGRRGRKTNEVVGWRCPRCGDGFNASLAPDSTHDRRRGRR